MEDLTYTSESQRQYDLPFQGDQLPAPENDRDGILRDPDSDPLRVQPGRRPRLYRALP